MWFNSLLCGRPHWGACCKYNATSGYKMITANLFFEDENSAYLIKFGQKEYLEQIREGHLRFSELSCFSSHKKQTAIFDKYEGIKYIKHLKNGRIEFSRIKEEIFISCFSYFTKQDIVNNRIFSPAILKERKWEYILFIFETEKFRNNIETALSNYRRASNTIKYLDYTKDQNNLTVFNKSNEYAFEKEFRFVFYPNENLFFQKKSQRVMNVNFEKVEGVIMPTAEFASCFSVIKN
mgnify:FL=1